MPRNHLRKDAIAGTVLGVESVPDALASGVLGGVNPLAGVYAAMFGTLGGAMFGASAVMSIQAAGSVALIVHDSHLDGDKQLYMLTIMTGLLMVAAGLAKGGRLLRFVPDAAMAGFISAIGVNIVLGQIDTLTGYRAPGANRLARAFNTLATVWHIDLPTTAIGIGTIVLIIALSKTKLGGFGLIIALVAGSVGAYYWNRNGADIHDMTKLLGKGSPIPRPAVPDFGAVFSLIVPAASIAFVGLLQGAAVAASVAPGDGPAPNESRDFIGQGVGNLLAGIFRGMPASGSAGATSVNVAAGAKTRTSLFVSVAAMAATLVVAYRAIGLVAEPAIAALLIVTGAQTVKPKRLRMIFRSGQIQAVVMTLTGILTVVLPAQFAVLAGAGIAIVLQVVRDSNNLNVLRIERAPHGRLTETDPPEALAPGEVVVLQPYGSMYFATSDALESQMPVPGPDHSGRSVVILRLRGFDRIGYNISQFLVRYDTMLAAQDCRLVLVLSDPDLIREVDNSGLADKLGEDSIYRSRAVIGDATNDAYDDAEAWIARGHGSTTAREPAGD